MDNRGLKMKFVGIMTIRQRIIVYWMKEQQYSTVLFLQKTNDVITESS